MRQKTQRSTPFTSSVLWYLPRFSCTYAWAPPKVYFTPSLISRQGHDEKRNDGNGIRYRLTHCGLPHIILP